MFRPFYNTFGPVSIHFWTLFGPILGPFWTHFRPILDPFWTVMNHTGHKKYSIKDVFSLPGSIIFKAISVIKYFMGGFLNKESCIVLCAKLNSLQSRCGLVRSPKKCSRCRNLLISAQAALAL